MTEGDYNRGLPTAHEHKGQHTLGNILRGRKACVRVGFMGQGTVSKLVHTTRKLVHFYVVAGTVCKSSAHDSTLKIEVRLSPAS